MPPRGGPRGPGARHGGGGRHGGHHHGHGGYGAPPFSWGGGPGWWDYPGSELVVIDDRDRERDKILAYIASLPEKERGKAFAKLFGAHPMSGVTDEIMSPKALLFAAGGLLAIYFAFFRRPR